MSLKAKFFKWLSGTDYDYYKDSYNRMLMMNERLIDDAKQLIDSSEVIQDIYDDRIKNIEALIAKVETVSELYKDLVKDYNELITNYDELVKKYNKIVKSNNNAINLLHKYTGMEDSNDDKLRGNYFYAGYTTVILAIKEAVENWVIEPINEVGSDGTAIFEDNDNYFIDVQELTRIVKTYLTMHDKDFIQVNTDVVICVMLRVHKILELTEDNKSMWCGNVYHPGKSFIKISKYTLSKALDGGDNSAD